MFFGNIVTGMNISPKENVIPLTPQVFYVLLALSEKSYSGYDIIHKSREDSKGVVELLSGTVYKILKRLSEMGYVKISATVVGSGPHGVRVIYELTDAGRLVLEFELERFREALAVAKSRT